MNIPLSGLHIGSNLHEAFVFGVELGRIIGALELIKEDEFDELVHTANSESVQRAADATGWEVEMIPNAGGWSRAYFTRLTVQ